MHVGYIGKVRDWKTPIHLSNVKGGVAVWLKSEQRFSLFVKLNFSNILFHLNPSKTCLALMSKTHLMKRIKIQRTNKIKSPQLFQESFWPKKNLFEIKDKRAFLLFVDSIKYFVLYLDHNIYNDHPWMLPKPKNCFLILLICLYSPLGFFKETTPSNI